MTIRDRLNELQGRADWTLDMWRDVALEALEFIASLQDGVGATVFVEADALRKATQMLIGGVGGKTPLTVVLDPSYSTYPLERCLFVGGAYDQRKFTLNAGQRERQTITLHPDQVYVWNGRTFQFDGRIHVQSQLPGKNDWSPDPAGDAGVA